MGCIWDISVPFSQFCCAPKTTLKQLFKKKQKTPKKYMQQILI